MPLAIPSFGGAPIFGINVRTQVTMNPSANQVAAFFGVLGTINLFGGTRGRMFLIEGNFLEGTVAAVALDQINFESYNDGVGRTLVDSWGRNWNNVVFEHFEPGRLISPPGGFLLPYKATFRGLA